jgi:hypothetical protein
VRIYMEGSKLKVITPSPLDANSLSMSGQVNQTEMRNRGGNGIVAPEVEEGERRP